MNDRDEHDGKIIADERRKRLSRRGFLTGSSAALATTGIATIGAAVIHDAAAAPPLQEQATPEALATPTGAAEQGASTETEAGSRAIQFFNIHEAATVDALVSRIIPGSPDDPGAHEAGVVFYIDQALGGPNLGYTLKTYTQGPFLLLAEEAEMPVRVEAAGSRDIYDYITVSPDLASRFGYQSVLTPQEFYRRGLEYVDAYAQSQYQNNYVDLTTEEQDQILTDMDEDKATGYGGPSARAFLTQLRNDTIEGMFGDPMYGGNRDLVGWNLIGYPGAQRFYTPDNILDPTFTRAPQSLAQLMENEGH
jgi:gluconate 2-dehydrogenase gamma chain